VAQQPVFLPKAFTCLRGYTRRQLGADLGAGLTVGVIALPLALAFGIASIPEDVARDAGISPPAVGLVTAIVAGFLISALGGTRASVGGPTGAFVAIIYAIAATHGFDGLVMATVLAGAILVVMGLARLGRVIKFIPYPVTTGFTAGIGVIIFAGQVRDLLGLATGPLPPEFAPKVRLYAEHIASIDPATASIGVGTALFIVLWRRFVSRRVPGAIIAIVLATVVVQVFGLSGVTTVGERFGPIPAGLPTPRMPVWDWSRIPDLLPAAFTIALLGAIESLLCAVVADGMLNTRHRSDTELIGQGLANIGSAAFGGLPATGAIARTAANVQAGGRTPVSGMTHAAALLAIVLLLGRQAGLVPLASLAGVLVVVAWNMAEVHRFRRLLNGPRSDALVLVVTFLLTVLTDLTLAVEVGVVLAAILFMKRMADVTSVGARSLTDDPTDGAGDTDPHLADATQPGRGVEIYEINGPFFFGAAYKLHDAMAGLRKPPRVLVLDLSRVPAIDATGLHTLDDLRARCVKERTELVLAGVNGQVRRAMARSGLLDALGADRVVESLEAGVRLAERDMAPSGA
jgi:SulP family sulfate permease